MKNQIPQKYEKFILIADILKSHRIGKLTTSHVATILKDIRQYSEETTQKGKLPQTI